jgi:Zn-finger nucleic acid-binding protein
MLKCPACPVPLCLVEYEGQMVHVCPDCRGALVQEPRLERIKRRREQKWSVAEEGRIAQEVAAADKTAWVRCPRCFGFMEKLKVSGAGHAFHLDRCGACQLVWLDPGELELIQIQYEKEIDSRTPEDWKRIERMGLAQLELNRQLEAEREELVQTDKTLRSVTVDFASVNLAAIVAAWAVIKVMEGMEEPSPVRRRRALIMAAVGISIVAVILLVVYYMGGPKWYLW